MTYPSTPPVADLPMAAADAKPWWRSATVWGAVAAIGSQAAALAGLTVDAGELTGIATDAVGLIGGLLALWGRVRAVQPIRR